MQVLRSIVYVSEALRELSDQELEELELFASSRNHDLGITGYLWSGRNRFLQYVEGDPDSVDKLFESIRNDPRHRIIGWVADSACQCRRFPDWSMRRLRLRDYPQISLELLLTDHLLLTSDAYVQDAAWESSAWRLVSALASLQGKGFKPSGAS